ncbi:MAG TPA: hypothetical protein VFO53_12435 [Casimicrobiaceae bacterium]|nr:hypothetical protein [Casimicrobiaceae bacterium]
MHDRAIDYIAERVAYAAIRRALPFLETIIGTSNAARSIGASRSSRHRPR